MASTGRAQDPHAAGAEPRGGSPGPGSEEPSALVRNAPDDPAHASRSADEKREYRTEELAAEAGIPIRTLRFYRERKLLPPPRREGRIAWYNEHHLTRLRTITALLARGHTLGGIADLLTAFERGRDTRSAAELLGLEHVLVAPFSEEVPVRLTPEQLADYYQGQVTVENLDASLDIGYVAVDGDEFLHVSRRLLEASAELVREGVPLAAVLEAGRQLRAHTDDVAELFTRLFREHLMPGGAETAEGAAAQPEPGAVAEALDRVRPLAKQIVEAELGLGLDRRIRAELEALWGDAGGAPGEEAPSEESRAREEAPGGLSETGGSGTAPGVGGA
ncbi:MerR family transcriptional regulator [Streptomyces sulphureus]|uniref:MerR family transcriptional regulator n=1 Tax=Streptomyces sulphureus TaxID=47758 RepID=UPI00037777BC|nr:MerR family transcriptional regulator [Streptomyces sulphureus]